MARFALVSDFDGTITATDFYTLIAQRYMPSDAPDYFAMYRAGELQHWEAMQGFFQHAPDDEEALTELMRDTSPDPALRTVTADLAADDWDLIIVSAGSSWYIDRILAGIGVKAIVYSIPGQIVPGRGLQLRLQEDAPFFSAEVGVDKPAVVRDALARYEKVAFAGDGLPDVAPALLVPPELRFARGLLAEELTRRRAGFIEFSQWSDVTHALLRR